MTAAGPRGRLRQAYLLFGTRVVCQATRLAWAPLLIYISKELNLNHAHQGQVLSSFSFGYLFTQVVGGMAADKFGGKPVQTVSLVGSSLGMLLIPVVVDYGYWALCSVYFLMGLCQGPSHPGYNAMAAIWFRASERGWVSSVCEAGPVTGTLLSLLIAPRLAATYGWRTAFTMFGLITTVWSIVWQHFAYSNPSEVPRENDEPNDEEAGVSSDCNTLSRKQLSSGNLVKHNKMISPAAGHDHKNSTTTHKKRKTEAASAQNQLHSAVQQQQQHDTVKTVARASSKFPFAFFTFLPVWGVIGQHMIFNTSRYFFADWTAIYYDERFNRNPETSGLLLSMPFAAGAMVQMLISGVEGPMIKRGWTPLDVRKIMGGSGFLITAVCLMMMTTTLNEYSFCFWLSLLEASLACHACGYKANYMDLTTRHQGIFMGTGNTVASICTFGMPLAVAAYLDMFHDWNGIFLALSALNFIGIFINQRVTVVKELHVAEV